MKLSLTIFSHIAFLTIFVYCAREDVSSEVSEEYDQSSQETVSRKPKTLSSDEETSEETWRTVNSRHWQNSNEWTPNDNFPLVPPQVSDQRRKRPLNRRRRPPVVSEEFNDPSSYEPPAHQRRRKIKKPSTPATLEEFEDPFGEMVQESLSRKPAHRRRLSPVYAPDSVEEHERPLETSLQVGEESATGEYDDESSFVTTKSPGSYHYEKVRDPFTALEEAEEKARLKKLQKQQQDELLQQQDNKENETTTVSDLKTLLKQSVGSISLSEILQQKNISLQDLLKGKEQAISALTEKPPEIVEIPDLGAVKEYRNPVEDYPVVQLITSTTERWKTIETALYTDDRKLKNASKEESSISRDGLKKTYPLTSHKYATSRYSSLKNFEVVTEPTTERRVFVPSHPKYYTALNYKTKLSDKSTIEATLEKVQTSRDSLVTRKPSVNDNKYLEFKSKYMNMRPKLKKPLPMTSAKINQLAVAGKKPTSSKASESSSSAEVTQLPPGAFTINVAEVLALLASTKAASSSTDIQTNTISSKIYDEEPMKMNLPVEFDPATKRATTATTEMTAIVKKIESRTKRPPYNPNKHISILMMRKQQQQQREKIKPTSAREEIWQVLNDRDGRTNLTKILEKRNMSVEELVEQRERGSSQIHLADIFHNQTKEPEPPKEPLVGRVIPPSPERHAKKVDGQAVQSTEDQNLPSFKKDKNDSSLSYGLKVLVSKRFRDEQQQEKKVTNFPAYKIEVDKTVNDSQTTQSEVLIWKSLFPTPNPNVPDSSNKSKILVDDIKRIEDIENSIAESINNELSVEVDENDYDETQTFFKLPVAVRSTIIASATIVAISCLMFLTIFITFKWNQRQKKRLSYVDSLGSSRIKSPILQSKSKSMIKTIMNETLGKQRRYSNVYPQSMSDYSWEQDDKKTPFQ